MRKFLIAVLSFLFFIVGSTAIAMLALYPIISKPTIIKAALDQSGIYGAAAGLLVSQFDEPVKKTPQLAPIAEAFKAEYTGDYLKSKFEPFLNQTYAFARGESGVLPSISFSDLTARLAARGKQFAKVVAETAKALNQGFTIPAELAGQIRTGYGYTRLSLIAISFTSLILLLLIFALGKGLGHRFRLVGKSLLVVGIANLASVLISTVLLAAQGSSLVIPNLPPALAEAAQKIIIFISQKSLLYAGIGSGAVTLVGLIFILTLGKKKKESASPSL